MKNKYCTAVLERNQSEAARLRRSVFAAVGCYMGNHSRVKPRSSKRGPLAGLQRAPRARYERAQTAGSLFDGQA
jgi:hypothetical protein